jgi:hypothetical protein
MWAIAILAMAKRPTKQQSNHSWAIYHIRGTSAQFIGIVFDQPDEQATIKKAIAEYDIPGEPTRQADGASAGLRAAGRKAVAVGANRCTPLPTGPLCVAHKFPLKTWALRRIRYCPRGDMRTEVLTCAMQSDFAVNVICYGYGGD